MLQNSIKPSENKTLRGYRQWQVFMLLVNGPKSYLTYIEISKAFDMTKPMVCDVTCRLARKGLIHRYSTGKGKAIRLTDWGKAFSVPLKTEIK